MLGMPLTSLESLKPHRAQKIMDLVALAGIDVTPWATKQDGTPVKVPSANPNFCYEWAFGGNDQPSLVCIWHKSLALSGDQIVYDDNPRDFALRLDRIANTRENPPHVKSRARDQAARARRFDSLLQRAYRTGKQVHVVLLEGTDRDEDELGWDRSEVRFRELDESPWLMAAYSDDSGALRLVRSEAQSIRDVLDEDSAEASDAVDPSEPAISSAIVGEPAALAEHSPPVNPPFVDQFSANDATLPPRHEVSSTEFARSSAVREAVLVRARGACEHCGQPGFKTAAGSIFLETHHVLALADGGPDQVWNVVGLCPNDHRRAHHGEDRNAIQQALLNLLIERYPSAASTLRAVVASGHIERGHGA
jgi:5-methylcytosine-specific restriction protein A